MGGMGGSSTGTISPSGEVSLSQPSDSRNWYKVRGCGGPTDIVWWKKGYPQTDMNIMQNYIFRGGVYVSKTPCPILPMNGKCPPGYMVQSQCPACSVGPGPRCLAPCRIQCVRTGTPCPSNMVCDGGGGSIPTPGGPGDYTGTCPKGQHFSHCGCICRDDGSIEPQCYEFCPTPGHGGMRKPPRHMCVENVLCIQGYRWSPTACKCVPYEAMQCGKGTRWSPCFQRCQPAGLLELSPSDPRCVKAIPPSAVTDGGGGMTMMMQGAAADGGTMMMMPMPMPMGGISITQQLQMYLNSVVMWAEQNPLLAAGIGIGIVLLLVIK